MEEDMEEKPYSHALAATLDYLGSSRKAPTTPCTVPDSFAPAMFAGSDVDAEFHTHTF